MVRPSMRRLQETVAALAVTLYVVGKRGETEP